jgi:hypothetical protein
MFSKKGGFAPNPSARFTNDRQRSHAFRGAKFAVPVDVICELFSGCDLQNF